MVSLDEYFDAGDRIGFLKFDKEGVELEVLKGADRILRQHAPCSSSSAKTGTSRRAAFMTYLPILNALATRAVSFAAGNCFRFPSSTRAIHQRQSGAWFWKSKGYLNNFILSQAGRIVIRPAALCYFFTSGQSLASNGLAASSGAIVATSL